MLYYLCAYAGQRAARYWGYLVSGSGASHGSSDLKQSSNSTSTKTTSSPALSLGFSGSPTSAPQSSSPQCRAVDSIAAESVILSDYFEATSHELKTFSLPAIETLTDVHAEAAPAHALTGFKGDAIVMVVKDRFGAPLSIVVPEEGLFTLKVDTYLPDTFDILDFFPPLHAMQRVALERLLSVAPMAIKRLGKARLIVCEAPPDFHAEGYTLVNYSKWMSSHADALDGLRPVVRSAIFGRVWTHLWAACA